MARQGNRKEHAIPTQFHHVKSLVDIAAIWATQNTIVNSVYERVIMGVKDLLDTRKIGGGELTECQLNEMVVKAVVATESCTQQ
jgi:hypothetical protein